MDHARELRETLDRSPDEFMSVAQRLGVDRRKAYYLVEIDRNLAGLKVDRERLAQIGWTKLQIISSHITPRNYEKLLRQAEDHPAYKLARLMKDEPVDPGARTHTVLLYLSEDEYDVFRRVLREHGADVSGGGISGKEQALTKALRKLDRNSSPQKVDIQRK